MLLEVLLHDSSLACDLFPPVKSAELSCKADGTVDTIQAKHLDQTAEEPLKIQIGSLLYYRNVISYVAMEVIHILSWQGIGTELRAKHLMIVN